MVQVRYLGDLTRRRDARPPCYHFVRFPSKPQGRSLEAASQELDRAVGRVSRREVQVRWMRDWVRPVLRPRSGSCSRPGHQQAPGILYKNFIRRIRLFSRFYSTKGHRRAKYATSPVTTGNTEPSFSICADAIDAVWRADSLRTQSGRKVHPRQPGGSFRFL